MSAASKWIAAALLGLTLGGCAVSGCVAIGIALAFNSQKREVARPAAPTSLEEKVAAWSHGLPCRREVASGYRFCVSQIEAGKLKADTWPATQQAIVLALATQTDAALGANLDKWSSFRRALRDELNSRDAAGGLKTESDYSSVLLEIAKGLEQ